MVDHPDPSSPDASPIVDPNTILIDTSSPADVHAAIRAIGEAVSERCAQILEMLSTVGINVTDPVGSTALMVLGVLIVEAHGGDLAQIAQLIPTLPDLFSPDLREKVAKIVTKEME